ncbi:MAG: type II toxin-antitoxin system HigB family toxin [Thermodesulfobacteriota bacterium]
MTLIGREKLHHFIFKNTDTRNWIENWIADVQNANWQSPRDIKNRYSNASFLANNIVIFNVKGNSYRLQVQIAYKTKKVNVVWIGTHAEYNKRFK